MVAQRHAAPFIDDKDGDSLAERDSALAQLAAAADRKVEEKV